MNRKDNLIWIDLEMTGLNPDRNRIIEIATVVTDKELTVLAEGPMFAVHQPDELLDAMDEWNTRQHANSGLTERVRAPPQLDDRPIGHVTSLRLREQLERKEQGGRPSQSHRTLASRQDEARLAD